MNKVIVLLVAALVAISAPLPAARVAVAPIGHQPMLVYEAYRGSSNLTECADLGYLGSGGDTIAAVPGVLVIDPGNAWANFVGAAHQSPAVPYSIKNVILQKQSPAVVQCGDILPARTFQQQGTRNIRLRWPLVYEVAGTTWTLTVLYGTTQPYDDDGPSGPNPASYVHTEVWQWQVDVTLDSMRNLLMLLHELPFGRGQVPLISDELLCHTLHSKLEEVTASVMATDSVHAGLALGEFEMALMDRCLSSVPVKPSPAGPGTGIAQTMENPACCKLLTDAEYLGFKLGIYQPRK